MSVAICAEKSSEDIDGLAPDELDIMRELAAVYGTAGPFAELDEGRWVGKDPNEWPRDRSEQLVLALTSLLNHPLSKEELETLAAVLQTLPADAPAEIGAIAAHEEELIDVTCQLILANKRKEGQANDRWARKLVLATVLKAAGELRDKPDGLPWCDLKAIFREIAGIADTPENERTDAQKDYLRFLKRAIDSGVLRRRGRMPEPERILSLLPRFPNFAEPIRFLAEQGAFSILRGEAAVSYVPILLVGSAGVGKTHFALALAEALGERAETLSMSAQTSGFSLSGLDRGWSSARPGMIFEAIMHGESLSPVMVLDEIDKANSDSRSSPLGPLYTLLEPRAARQFRDEYAGFGINATQVFWLATANEVSGIPGPLLSRFRVFEIPEPDAEQVLAIAANIYDDACRGIAGAPLEMPEAWRGRLAGLSMREIRINIQQALGRAALRAVGRKEPLALEDDDLPAKLETVRKRIGFIG